MNCDCIESGKPLERNGHTASCARASRKAQENALKEPKKRKPIKKVGTKNLFECSDRTKVNQEYINRMRALCYALMDEEEITICECCGKNKSEGHAHIIPQARCKQIGKTELIWSPLNIVYADNRCNSIMENVSSQAFTKLMNFERLKAYLEQEDPERASKICYSKEEKHPI